MWVSTAMRERKSERFSRRRAKRGVSSRTQSGGSQKSSRALGFDEAASFAKRRRE